MSPLSLASSKLLLHPQLTMSTTTPCNAILRFTYYSGAVSMGRRNNVDAEFICWSFKFQCLSRSLIQPQSNFVEVSL